MRRVAARPECWHMKEILLIEDSESDAELLQRTFRQVGVINPVRWLTTGEEALVYLKEAIQADGIGAPVPSVLIIDLKLPGVNGFQILETVKQLSLLAKSLRVVISSLEDTQSIKMAYAAGAHTFVVKPAKVEDITELIHSFPGYWTVAGRDGVQPGASPSLFG